MFSIAATMAPPESSDGHVRSMGVEDEGSAHGGSMYQNCQLMLQESTQVHSHFVLNNNE
jgi:hypothetical protein